MTSDCAGDQVSQESVDSTLVKATGAIGSHDRLNEAPRQDPFITAGYIRGLSDRLGLEDTDLEYMKAASDWILYLLRDGQPG